MPKQLSLFPKLKPREIKRRRHLYAAQNLDCARQILADIDAWGGPEAAMVRWARAVVEQNERG